MLCNTHFTFRESFENFAPDSRALHNADKSGNIFGVILTMRGPGAPDGYDFLSRYFAPWNGIPEDPVTGRLHLFVFCYQFFSLVRL